MLITLFSISNNHYRSAIPGSARSRHRQTSASSMNPTAPPAFADIHLLTVLAETRSFTQAAHILRISKASASTRISELEKSVGMPLVRRTTRSVVLTEAGSHLVNQTQAAFAHISQAVTGIQDLAGEPRGLVRMTCPVALGRQVVMPELARFLKRFPEIRLEIDLHDQLTHLARAGFDLAIRHTDSPPENMIAWPLCDTRSLLVASADYLRAHGTPRHPAELSRHACLLYLRGGPTTHWAFERSRGRSRRQPPERLSVPVQGPLQVNNSEALREAALAGLGIGLLSDFSAAQALGEGRLHPVLDDWRPVDFFGGKIYAIRPWSARIPRAVECLVDHLRHALAAPAARPA